MKLLAGLDAKVVESAEVDTDPIELSDPRRLVDVDAAPPNPVKPREAGCDASGNKRPVLVILESHMR
jgi:hypothetical protein